MGAYAGFCCSSLLQGTDVGRDEAVAEAEASGGRNAIEENSACLHREQASNVCHGAGKERIEGSMNATKPVSRTRNPIWPYLPSRSPILQVRRSPCFFPTK